MLANFLKLSSAVFAFSTLCFSQRPISFGVKAGVPITDAFTTRSQFGETDYSASKMYIAGAMLELRLPFHLAIEVDGLYRPVNLTTHVVDSRFGIDHTFSDDFKSWEFPVLAKYRFATTAFTPYVEAGPNFRALEGAVSFQSRYGATLGAGVEARLSVLRIAPEFRFTHWGNDIETRPLTSSKRNQVEFLVGITL